MLDMFSNTRWEAVALAFLIFFRFFLLPSLRFLYLFISFFLFYSQGFLPSFISSILDESFCYCLASPLFVFCEPTGLFVGDIVQLVVAGFLVSHLAGELSSAEECIHFFSPFLEFFKLFVCFIKYSLALKLKKSSI